MDIKKLLFVTGFEELRFDALQVFLELKKAALEHVVFLNVIERDKVAMHRGVGYQKSEEIRLREKANIRFIDWAEYLFEQGLEVGVYILVGDLVHQVLTTIQKEEVDLVVIGQQKVSKFKQFYLGSNITELVRRSPVPVLVFKFISEEGGVSEKPFQRPLFATDWSPASLRAVEYLKGLKNVAQKIDVIHVASEKSLKGESAMKVQKTRKDTREKLDEIGDIFEQSGITSRSHVYIGDPVTEIEHAARECQSSMIVTGASVKRSWKEKWEGGVARTLAEKSAFPILLVPEYQKSS